MKVYKYPKPDTWKSLCERPAIDSLKLEEIVRPVLEAVRQNGDKALKEFNRKFDGVVPQTFLVSRAEFVAAEKKVSKKLKEAIQLAKENIERFHSAQREKEKRIETTPGVVCWRKSVAIEKVGLYIPGGSAPLFSTLLMLGIPAKIAGCRKIVVCTPSGKNGIAPEILYTAKLLGIDQVYKAGGAQAVAAMCYGTQTIPAVDKIFGPGNQYVTMAKMLAQQHGVAIDMPAGPSEVLVIADKTAEPEFVAADLLSQAEHGSDSQVILVSDNAGIIEKVLNEIVKQLKKLPRKQLAAKALQNSKAILIKNLEQAIEFSNSYAPEHLIIAAENAEQLASLVLNAGSVFLGNYSCESAGDYASGTNHTLPTNGFARSYSGVSLDSFVKKITFQHLSEEGIANIGAAIEQMAAAEQLDAHKNAVTVRLNAVKKLPKVERKFNLEKLLRLNIKVAKPYSSARDEFSGRDKIFLDANENPFDTGYNRYPDPHQHQLKEKISKLKKISAKNIFLGNGSDEAIDLVVRAFCNPGEDRVIICPPTYGMYEVAAQINDLAIERAPLQQDFHLDVNTLLQAASQPDVKLIFLCSPNNPTGNLLKAKDIKTVLQKFKGIVVLDEAYADFSAKGSLLSELKTYPNLIILQTFSKAWGLAGIRLGMAFASEEITIVLDKIKPPYNISELTQQQALKQLESETVKNEAVKTLVAQRNLLTRHFSDSSKALKVFSSDSNFLLVKFREPKKIYQYLLANGVVVRDRSSVAEGCLRITIGTPEENKKLITLLNQLS